MKKINHILFIMAATAALMIAGCRKDSSDGPGPVNPVNPVETPVQDLPGVPFNVTLVEERSEHNVLWTVGADGSMACEEWPSLSQAAITRPVRMFLYAKDDDGNPVKVNVRCSDGSLQVLDYQKSLGLVQLKYAADGSPTVTVWNGSGSGTHKVEFKPKAVETIPLEGLKVRLKVESKFYHMGVFDYKMNPPLDYVKDTIIKPVKEDVYKRNWGDYNVVIGKDTGDKYKTVVKRYPDILDYCLWLRPAWDIDSETGEYKRQDYTLYFSTVGTEPENATEDHVVLASGFNAHDNKGVRNFSNISLHQFSETADHYFGWGGVKIEEGGQADASPQPDSYVRYVKMNISGHYFVCIFI
jgi:hypothetical protein